MNMMKYRATGLVMISVVLLNACGGGGGEAGCSVYGGCNPSVPGTTAVASSLVLNLSETSVQNAAILPVTATVTAVNSSNERLANIPVQFSVDGALFSPAGATTTTNGTLTATVDASNEKANRVVTVTAKSGALTATKTFVVSGIKVTGTASPSIVVPGNPGAIEFLVVDSALTPVANTTIAVTSPFGNATSTTNSSGKFTYSYNIPSNYGSSEFVANVAAAGVAYTQTVAVQLSSGNTIPAARAPVASSVVEINPSVVGVNTAGSTEKSVTVRFKAFDSASLPIKDVRVSFDLNGDPALIGGSLSSGSNFVLTDSNGVATTTYTPGTRDSATNGLTIRACYSTVDFVPSVAGNAATGSANCPNERTQTLTIDNEALNITIGSDDAIGVTDDGLRYVVKYVVQVVNASGQAMPNVQITPTLDLLGFEKGYFFYDEDESEWVGVRTVNATYPDPNISSITYVGCRNEDRNRNGINDGVTEDLDQDGILEPRKSDAAVSFLNPGVLRTDATGAVALQITYLKNVATWLNVKLSVKGAVSGTEGVGTFVEQLPAPFSATNSQTTPAFATNPYGRSNSCGTH